MRRALISYHHHLGFFPRSLGGRFLIYNARVRLGGASLSQASRWVVREDGLPTLDRTGVAWGGGFSCLGALGQGSLNSLCWRPADPLPILRQSPPRPPLSLPKSGDKEVPQPYHDRARPATRGVPAKGMKTMKIARASPGRGQGATGSGDPWDPLFLGVPALIPGI